ncbi:MAG TPA: hypothetical protein PKH02_03905 [Bacteroidales bacterium]|nr:hypothetical protein [Bacteroidales bacterium]HPT12325.1 hypothetical protein [Bacteroidales bacterium]
MTLPVKPDFSDRKTLEKYSSAYTLSDMEIFIFPELFYPLVIANIMSPIIWKWRDDPWFRDIEKKNFTYKVNRIKQYIIDHYIFNLDLETWGLTDKKTELARFSDFFDTKLLAQSNALFGYEGDKYYFDLDIRKHFGLDKYDSDIIPYWKTETVEAMTAFTHKEHFTTGAGECVSLAALYAATMFIVGRIPLEKIYLMATPLHSQNFIDEKDGLITNNRRIMTKNMWFNGTSLSEKARRAVENEKITIVSHITGYIHTVYDEATIDPVHYQNFSRKISDFVVTELSPEVFINFLRFKKECKCLFQYKYLKQGVPKYISLEKMFEYEHTSRFSVNAEMREKLLEEIDSDEFSISPLPGKIMLNDMEAFLSKRRGMPLKEMEQDYFNEFHPEPERCSHRMFNEIKKFIITKPQLPSMSKKFTAVSYPAINVSDSREQIIETVKSATNSSEVALLTMYAYRDMESAGWLPFIKAAIERNPVCHAAFAGRDSDHIFSVISAFENISIYDSGRLAQPDEVWNFRCGDGIEKAILMADALFSVKPDAEIAIDIQDENVNLTYDDKNYSFTSIKGYSKKFTLRKNLNRLEYKEEK